MAYLGEVSIYVYAFFLVASCFLKLILPIIVLLFCPHLCRLLMITSYSCRTPEEVLAAKGVKPTLSPNLNTLSLVEVCNISLW